MKSLLTNFKEEASELENNLKNRINLLNSPVNIVNEKEIKDIQRKFLDYSKIIENLNRSMSTLEENKKNNTIEDNGEMSTSYKQQFDLVMKKFKLIQNQIEEIILRYEQEELKNSELRFIGDDVNDNLSEYTDIDKLEFTKVFLNSMMTTKQADQLMKTETLAEEKKFISEIFNLKEFFPNVLKRKILEDFYMNLYKFCLKEKFSIEKLSTIMSIVYFIFSYSIIGKKIIKEKSEIFFHNIIEFHSLNRPPYSYEIFSCDDTKKIKKFIAKTFFRNYSLFENIFKYNVNVYLKTCDFQTIPNQNIPNILADSNYNLKEENFISDPKSLEIIDSLFFTNVQKKPNRKSNNILQDDKDEWEKIEEARREKIKAFMSSFYKSKSDFDKEKALIEQLAREKEIEYEINEVKNYLDKKIQPIIIEAEDKIVLADKFLMNDVEESLGPFLAKHKK